MTSIKNIICLDDEGNELILPRSETISADFFKKSDTLRAVVRKVELKNNSPVIILSRTDKGFLAKLLELEVPEIFDGLITIKRIEREPGERAKVAVESYDDRIDPVGACVGMKGSRIHGIVRELKNENIDIINYTDNQQLLIQRALSPARILSMNVDTENKSASVYLKPEEVSKAIGKDDDDVDIDIDEFSDEIAGWMLDELKKIGCDTAKSVLELSKDELVRRTDLEEEMVTEILKILEEEFEKDTK